MVELDVNKRPNIHSPDGHCFHCHSLLLFRIVLRFIVQWRAYLLLNFYSNSLILNSHSAEAISKFICSSPFCAQKLQQGKMLTTGSFYWQCNGDFWPKVSNLGGFLHLAYMALCSQNWRQIAGKQDIISYYYTNTGQYCSKGFSTWLVRKSTC